jgi:hypothetical protein
MRLPRPSGTNATRFSRASESVGTLVKVVVFAKAVVDAETAVLDFEPIRSALDTGLGAALRVERGSISRAVTVRAEDEALRLAAPYDTVIELYVPVADGLIGALSHCSALTDIDAFVVDEYIEKAPRLESPDASPAGISWWAPLVAPPNVSPGRLRRHYDEHVSLALRVHRATSHYIRHWVTRDLGPLNRPYYAISLLRFPTDEDFMARHYDSPAGQAEVREDVIPFVDLQRIRPLPTRTLYWR